MFAPFPLPFAPSVTDIREWNVEIDPPGTTLPTSLPIDGKLKVSLHRILIETGIALTLAESSWDPRSWYALYRYGGDFAGKHPRLRFYSGARQKDPRLTAVASEEVAVGVSCFLLREHFNLDHIADVYACIKHGELEYVNSKAKKDRPDFFCEDNSRQTVIAESKGSAARRQTLINKVDKEGWDQVQNVRPVNKPLRNSCSRAVLGTHFCVEGQNPEIETTTFIKDPEGSTSLERNPDSDMIIRLAYAKALRFAGQDVLAERLILRHDFPEPFLDLESIRLLRLNGTPILPLGFTAFGDVIALYGPTAKALFSTTTRSVTSPVAESLRDWRERRGGLNQAGYGLPNGVVILHEFDELAVRF